jgi:hypothetical protein
MKFSQRIGITPISKEIQLSSIDQDLKNGLWNIYENLIFNTIFPYVAYVSPYADDFNDNQKAFLHSLWHDFFKLTLDKAPSDRDIVRAEIREWFFKSEWYGVYDLIEFSYAFLTKKSHNINIERIEKAFNIILEREFSAYRFIKGNIAPIINEHEISELGDVLAITKSFSALNGCNIHLDKALSMLSDKKNPDYRNSIKESISAVESLVKVIAQKPGAELSSAIDRIKGQIKIHPSLEQGFKKIYGYTSDEGGIRHAMMDESICDFEDAKFMLISCSAFINYLIVKANKTGITFQ